MKTLIRNRAVQLRKQGKSYSEILQILPVSKSTLSLWLRKIGLSAQQKQVLSQKKLASALRGAQKRREQRYARTKNIRQEALSELQEKIKIDEKTLWLMGVILYWAEGAKEKIYRTSQSVIFSNSDPLMVKIFILWIKQTLGIPEDRLVVEIYIHENQRDNLDRLKQYWASVSGFNIQKFDRIYYKRSNTVTFRKNLDNNYHGQLRIRIRKSTDLNRKITAWIEGICQQCGVVQW